MNVIFKTLQLGIVKPLLAVTVEQFHKSLHLQTMFTNPSYWHSPGTEPLSPLTMGQLLDVAAERWGDREAVVSVFQDHRLTFKQVRDKVTCKSFLSFQKGNNL
jgi:hypothetical protein